MTMTDPIADMLTRLRNANSAYHDTVSMPYSKLKAHIAEILQQEGYIAGWKVADAEVGKTLTLELKYGPNRERSIAGMRRVSQARSARLREVDRTCRASSAASASRSCPRRPVCSPTVRPAKKGVGGEVLAYVW